MASGQAEQSIRARVPERDGRGGGGLPPCGACLWRHQSIVYNGCAPLPGVAASLWLAAAGSAVIRPLRPLRAIIERAEPPQWWWWWLPAAPELRARSIRTKACPCCSYKPLVVRGATSAHTPRCERGPLGPFLPATSLSEQRGGPCWDALYGRRVWEQHFVCGAHAGRHRHLVNGATKKKTFVLFERSPHRYD